MKRIFPHIHYHTSTGDNNQSRLVVSIVLNLLITAAEVIGGIVSNSLALLSDAMHNFNDSVSLGISLIARKVSRKDADVQRTFGYRRAEIIGAFINLVTLVLISLFLIKEGIQRFFDPHVILGPVMFIVATVGLIGNFVTAFLLHRGSKVSINMRSAYLHILSDGLSSIGVIIAGLLIIQYKWFFVDTIVTIIIAGYILLQSFVMLKKTINILMEGSPSHIDPKEIANRVSDLDGVENMHHVHIWNLDESNYLFEAHVLIKKCDLESIEKIKRDIKRELETQYQIHHSTLEFEFENCAEEQDNNCAETYSSQKL
jgi:cobalt-zinc-cadmium efflux system protein